MTEEPKPALRTELDLESGLTYLFCTICKQKKVLGETLIHQESCPEKDVQVKRKRYTNITKTMTYQVPCEITEEGTIIEP